MGKTQATISNKLRLLNLDEDVQNALLNNKISERHARSILRVDDKNLQKEILQEILDKRLNVRDTENLINEKLNIPTNDEFIQISNLSPTSFEFPKLTQNNISQEDEITNLDTLLNSAININNNVDKYLDSEEQIEIMSDEELNAESILDINIANEKIQNTIKELEKLGFNVKLEKSSFGGLHQFIIKIEE